MTNAGENAQVLSATNQQMQKMTNAFNNVAKAIEMDAAAGADKKKTKKKAAAGGGKTRKKKRRKKGTKKKARTRKR